MGSLRSILKHPDDFYPLMKLKMAARNAEKQIPPEPHWAFCYTMLHKVSRSFALVIQQLGTDLRNAVSVFSITPSLLLFRFRYFSTDFVFFFCQVCIFYLVLRALDTVGLYSYLRFDARAFCCFVFL